MSTNLSHDMIENQILKFFSVVVMVGCFLTASADQAVLELEQSEDLIVWDPVPMTAAMLGEDGKINMGESAQTGFFRMRIEMVPTVPLAGFVVVEGGTLPSSSALGAVSVDTFYIGTYETTWGEWQTVRTWAALNGYDIGSFGDGCADDHPVHSVAWFDVVKWCNAKSEMEGLTPVFTYSGSTYKTGEPTHTSILQNLSANGYRLPQEAEWEFAARGGNQTNGTTYSGSNTMSDVGWYGDNSFGPACVLWAGRGIWPVGGKSANELGLYDMSGNVFEWCWDQVDVSNRRIRGGSWDGPASNCTVSNQNYIRPDYRLIFFGFRLARSTGN
jgi:sulfatase modifying factor 1